MPIPSQLQGRIDLPVIGAPMLTPASAKLVIAQCLNGIVGAFPSLSARPQDVFEDWLYEIEETLDAARTQHPDRTISPFAVNQIVHKTNARQEQDFDVCLKHKVPIILTSLGPSAAIVKDVHGYGGIVFHDVASVRHAEKAIEQGVDGLILVCAGAGGQGGVLNPFAFVAEVRRFYQGPLIVAGTITTGQAIAAVQMMGADMAIIGTLFIATEEANVDERYHRMLVSSSAKDVIFSPYFNGVHGNWLKPSIAEMGIDPDSPKLLWKKEEDGEMKAESLRRWTDILAAGQGVGNIVAIESAAAVIARLKDEYRAAIESFRAGVQN